MVRVLIIEDEIIIGRYLEGQLAENFPCSTRIAVSAGEAREAMAEWLPHLLLCDINLQEDQTGIDLVNEWRKRYAFEVIYITSYQTKGIIEAAAATQAANYIIKPVDDAQLFAGVQLVMSRIVAGEHTGRTLLQADRLFTGTELQILRLIREKKTTREIGTILHLSPYTIKNHRHAICRKLELRDENNALLKWVSQDFPPTA